LAKSDPEAGIIRDAERLIVSITNAHQAAGFKSSPASTRNFIVGETLKGVMTVAIDIALAIRKLRVHQSSARTRREDEG
jgi:hypothetical protein